MVTVGGPGYRWKGKNIRPIYKEGVSYVSMPRKNSIISVPVDIKPAIYKVTITARNISGNGAIAVDLSDSEKFHTYVKNKLPHNYSFDIPINHINGTASLDISRPPGASGNVLIEEIAYEELEIPKQPEKDLEAERRLERERKRRQAVIEAKAADQNQIISIDGDGMGAPVKIGGKGYRWRGKKIRTGPNFGSTCVYMPSQQSLVMVPIKASPKTQYTITITAAKVGNGNGSILINIFGNRKFDGAHSKLTITSSKPQKYTTKIASPEFPNNLPINLRIWRPKNSSANVCIKDIMVAQVPSRSQSKLKSKIPKQINIKSSKRKKYQRRRNLAIDKIKLPKEDYDMKFKPYSSKPKLDEVEKVLVRSADQVPKVSIITPTRDGKHLLEKCYEALNKNTAYPNWEWIVGDSNSQDDTIEFLKSLDDSRIKIIERGTTEGSFSSINNELAEYADGDYYLFLNNDTEPKQFWLYEMVSKINRNADIGIVGARLEYKDDKIQHAGIAFTPDGPANLGKSCLKSFGKDFAKHDRLYQAVTGACMLMRKEDFKAVKGFDPAYYFCYEDVDLCLKIRYQLGKKILYAANARIKHLESATQKRHKTAGDKQKRGIDIFKQRWMPKVEKDFVKYMQDSKKNIYKVDISFVTCVNNLTQYRNYVVGSLLMNKTKYNYEIIPIMNFGNPYSAAQALNLGIKQSRGNVIVLCHQDVIFYENWINLLFERIKQISQKDRKWGVLGTAGITTKDATIGVVHNIKGSIQWQSTVRKTVSLVQTVDEHCMIIRKNSNLRFDDATFDGFHFYGPDLCLTAMSRGMKNYGILCPLVHDSASGSLVSGKQEFMRLLNALAKKWRSKFSHIRTATSVIRRGNAKTFVRFKRR